MLRPWCRVKARPRWPVVKPLRRFTEPEEVADAVAFLTGDASSGITGTDLTVAAGYVMN